MSTHPFKSLVQINTLDDRGGAARIACMLHDFAKREGYQAEFIVGRKLGSAPDTVELRSLWLRFLNDLPVPVRLSRLVRHAGRALWHRIELLRGLEDLGNPCGRDLAQMLPGRPDLVLCHNLHGGFFDLRALTALSRRYPVVLLLHDAWLLAGHCAHSFDCQRWVAGCGACPYLDVQYALKRDTSHANWVRKKRILDSCRLYLVTPSQWLMDKADRSLLAPAVALAKVINNGVDQKIFCPGDQQKARAELGLAAGDHVVMFAAHGISGNIWKDYDTMRAAVCAVARELPQRAVRFLAVGESAPDERIGSTTISFVPHRTPEEIASYYRAADVYLHAAKADTFPNTVIEALSCGTPVVATAVGGVSEQIKGWRYAGDASGLNDCAEEVATGILTPPGDARAMCDALLHLLARPQTLQKLSAQAARDARERFDMDQSGGRYLEFFEAIIADWKAHHGQ